MKKLISFIWGYMESSVIVPRSLTMWKMWQESSVSQDLVDIETAEK